MLEMLFGYFCSLEVLLGYTLYNGAVYMLGHWLGHMYISKQFPSLGTPTFTAVCDAKLSSTCQQCVCLLAIVIVLVTRRIL